MRPACAVPFKSVSQPAICQLTLVPNVVFQARDAYHCKVQTDAQEHTKMLLLLQLYAFYVNRIRQCASLPGTVTGTTSSMHRA